jgi:CHASE1-domain containing sensor protein
MGYVRSAFVERELFAESSTPVRRGFFRRFFDALMLSRQRQADREIARYLQNSKFTDETEREIERLFLSTPPRF